MWDDEDDFDYDEDDEPFCYECQNRGYIPAMDFEAIQGIHGWACNHCERGWNSNYPSRPRRATAS